MGYIVKITDISGLWYNYIAEGRNYTVARESFVPFTTNPKEAKVYKSRKVAEKAGMYRKGANMIGKIEIIEV